MKSYFTAACFVFTNVKIYFAAVLFVNGKSNAKQLKTFTFAAV
jgi:hypothetical protein